jgi:hypothetical protein
MDCEVGVRHGGLEKKGVSKLGQNIINLNNSQKPKWTLAAMKVEKKVFF